MEEGVGLLIFSFSGWGVRIVLYVRTSQFPRGIEAARILRSNMAGFNIRIFRREKKGGGDGGGGKGWEVKGCYFAPRTDHSTIVRLFLVASVTR